jgi:ABC-type branched-subunit amino acid transport system substrate-binding protein
LALIACAITACGTPSRAREVRTMGNAAERRVKIAVLAPTRGELAPSGIAIRTGAHVALDVARDAAEDASHAPGVQASIELLDVDAGDGGVDDTRRAAEMLAGRTDVVAVIVGVPVGSADAAVKAISRSGAALITIGGVPLRGAYEVGPTPMMTASAAGRLVGSVLRAKHPAVLAPIGGPEPALFTRFMHSTRRFTAAPHIQTYPIGLARNPDPLQELARLSVDVVYLPGPLDRLVAAMRLASAAGLRAIFVVEQRHLAPDIADAIVGAGLPAYALASYALDDGEPITRDFVERFRRAGAGAPTDDAALAYDAVRLAYGAIAAAKRPDDPAAVTGALATVTGVPSLSGPIGFDLSGNAVRTVVVREVGTNRVFARVTP